MEGGLLFFIKLMVFFFHIYFFFSFDFVRRECPAEECGAGVFMAMHPDRAYCGKCHLTYVFEKKGEKEEDKEDDGGILCN